jgi:hypothetical protein
VTITSEESGAGISSSSRDSICRNKNLSSGTEIAKENAKTYNRRDSQMVTHSSTSRPVQCLCYGRADGVVFRHLKSQNPGSEIEFQNPGLSSRIWEPNSLYHVVFKSREFQVPGITPSFPGSSFLEQQKGLKLHDFGRSHFLSPFGLKSMF